MTDDAVGVVLGHQAASSQAFQVGIDEASSLEVDDLVAVTTDDPGGEVTTYGVVTEAYAQLEGTSLPSDTQAYTDGQMPAQLIRTAEVQVVRVDPERWIAPHPGQPVRKARGEERIQNLQAIAASAKRSHSAMARFHTAIRAAWSVP